MGTRRLTCTAARGRKVDSKVTLHLIAAAAGRCERPDCPTGFLWFDLADGKSVRLAEVAHIVAASDDGPRGDTQTPTEDLVGFANLILLCPTCHTAIDKAPAHFPTQLLLQWKRRHEERIADVLSVPRLDSRAEAQAHLRRYLAQNKTAWEAYGPESPASAQPETAATWLREVAQVIIPNNARISALFEVNVHLLLVDEHETVAKFDLHRRGLEARHLGVDVGVSSSRFPRAVEDVFNDAMTGT